MIPALILYLFRRYKRTNPIAAERLFVAVKTAGKTLVFLIACMAVTYVAFSQEKKLNYVIKRKGSEVGSLSFIQHSSGNKTVLKISSEVRTRMIFLFTANGEEEAVYENGILTSSWIFRKMNGSEKANKRTRLNGNNYIITKGNKSETLNNYPIRFNMLSLYSLEPLTMGKVYSDNFQAFLDIQTIAPHHYKIKFPDGNYNEYFYRNGVCATVVIHHSMYNATIELKA